MPDFLDFGGCWIYTTDGCGFFELLGGFYWTWIVWCTCVFLLWVLIPKLMPVSGNLSSLLDSADDRLTGKAEC